MRNETTTDKLIHVISESDYAEGGVLKGALSSGIRDRADTVVIAINNGDQAGAYASLFESDPADIAKGALLLAELHNAKNLVIHIPQSVGLSEVPIGEGTGSDCARSNDGTGGADGAYSAPNISFVVGAVNKRNYPDAIYHHITAAISAAQIVDGRYTDGIYASVNGSELLKYQADAVLSDILSGLGISTHDVSAVISGYRLYGSDALNLPLCDIYPENGSIRIITGSECPVRITAELLKASYTAGCGKCVFCREGLNQLQLMTRDIADGNGKASYPDIMREIAGAMKNGTLCTLGQNCGDIALDLTDRFSKEMTKHIKKKRCTPGVCFSNDTYYIDPSICDGCGKCLSSCPVDAIDGMKGYIHMIDSIDCTRCGKCVGVCPLSAVKVTEGRPPRLPDRLTRAGHFISYL